MSILRRFGPVLAPLALALNLSCTELIGPGDAAHVAVVSGDGQTGTVGAPLAALLVVKVTNPAGKPVSGVFVEWQVAPDAGSAAAASDWTDNNGQASARWTLPTKPGRYEARAWVLGLPVAVFQATVAAGAPATLGVAAGNDQAGIVGERLADSLALKVTDRYGNPLAGVNVPWTVASGGGSVGSQPTQTDANGIAKTVWTLGGTPGIQTVAATVSGLPELSFRATGRPATTATLSKVSGDGQAATVGAPLADSLVVLAADRFGNPVPGVAVGWTASGGGQVSPTSGTTGADGVARARWVLSTTAGGNTATASVQGVPVATFTATGRVGAIAAVVKLGGDAQSGTVASPLSDSLWVRVTDTYGNGVSGATVTWSASGGGSASPATATTNPAGEARTRWTLGTASGSQTMSVAAGAATAASFSASGLPAAAASLAKVLGDGQSAAAGAPLADSLGVQVTDLYGNGVPGVVVTWTVTAGAGSMSHTTSTTDGSGQAKVRWTLGGTPGANTATASVDGLTVATFSATATTGSAALLTKVSGDGQTATVGANVPDSLVVRVADALGNPVSGAGVAWTISAGGGSASPTTSSTDSSGLAKTSWKLGVTPGANAVAASVSGITPATFTATAVVGAAAAVTKAAGDAQSATVGTVLADSLVAIVQDAFGNPVSGVGVVWAVSAGGGSISQATSTTDGAGRAKTRWTLGTVAGAHTVTATVSGLTPATFTATAAAAAAAAVAKVGGDAQSARVGVSLVDSLVVKVTDSYGNPVSGISVTWVVTAGGGSVSPTSSTTNSAGQAKARWTLGTVAGANTVTATAVGIGAVTFSATATVGVAASVAKVSGDTQTAAVGTILPDSLVVIVKDSLGNPVSGITVAWAVTAGAGSVSPASSTTGSTGQAKTRWTLGTTPGASTATATVTGLAAVSFSATAVTGAAAAVVKVSGDAQTDTVGTALNDSLVVKVTDSYGNPVSGASVLWAVTAGGGSVSPASATTGSTGQAKARWILGTTAGTNTVSATVTGLSPVSFSATGSAGAAASMIKVSGDGQAATKSTTLPDPPTVTVRDTFGNAVQGATVTWALVNARGSLGTTSSTTNASGVASTSWTLGGTAPASDSVTASTPGVSAVTFAALVGQSGATQVLRVSGDGQSGTAGTQLASPVKIRVLDANGAAVVNAAVTWKVAVGGGSVATSTMYTDASGEASTTWTLGPAAGSNIVTASVTGITPVAFVATGN